MTKLDLKGSVLLVVAYSGIFSFPLTFAEIKKRLLFFSKVSNQELAKILRLLVKLKQIEFKGKYFFVGQSNVIRLRQEKAVFSQEKIVQSQRLVKLVGWLPWIRAMAVSGSTAVDNAKATDDLDWLVITSDHSLWLVRPILLLLAIFFGKKRGRNGHHRDNSWCFNMFLTESSLALPADKKSIYTAYEVCQAKFLLAKPGVEKEFLMANNWAAKFLPNYFFSRLEETSGLEGVQIGEPWLLSKSANYLAYRIQYWYMKSHITREKVAINVALFHPRDTKSGIYRRWLKLINLPYVISRN